MKFLFLVSSSIKHFGGDDYSAYTTEERFEQTMQTIRDIKEKVKDPYIALFDNSQTPIDDEYRIKIQKECDLFLDLSSDSGIQSIYSNIENRPDFLPFAKSILETYGLMQILYKIKSEDLFDDAQRIFKMSGRYNLNDKFNIEDYKSNFLKNRYVFKKFEYIKKDYDESIEDFTSQFENVYQSIYGLDGSVVTGLWSFDKNLINNTIVTLQKCMVYMERMIRYTGGVDIEHSLYKFLDKSLIVNIPELGLTLNKGLKSEEKNVFSL
jgi:hypothetical protein